MIPDPERSELEKYAFDQITKVCNEIGPRMPGSQEEAGAHDYIKQELAKFVEQIFGFLSVLQMKLKRLILIPCSPVWFRSGLF